MWAVVVAEGLDIFWALRKGEGCLGCMGPDTAAIGMMGWEGPISMGEKKFGDRAIEGRRGRRQLTGTNGGRSLIKNKGEGKGRARGTERSHGEAILFF
jgi:hypothetical protein